MDIYLNTLSTDRSRARLYSDVLPGDVFTLKDITVGSSLDWNYGRPLIKTINGVYNLITGQSFTTPSAGTFVMALQKSFVLNPSDYTDLIIDENVPHQVTLTGSENWSKISGNYPYARLLIDTNNTVITHLIVFKVNPSWLEQANITSSAEAYNIMDIFQSSDNKYYIGFRPPRDAIEFSGNISNYKSWLAQNQTTIIYYTETT